MRRPRSKGDPGHPSIAGVAWSPAHRRKTRSSATRARTNSAPVISTAPSVAAEGVYFLRRVIAFLTYSAASSRRKVSSRAAGPRALGGERPADHDTMDR